MKVTYTRVGVDSVQSLMINSVIVGRWQYLILLHIL